MMAATSGRMIENVKLFDYDHAKDDDEDRDDDGDERKDCSVKVPWWSTSTKLRAAKHPLNQHHVVVCR